MPRSVPQRGIDILPIPRIIDQDHPGDRDPAEGIQGDKSPGFQIYPVDIHFRQIKMVGLSVRPSGTVQTEANIKGGGMRRWCEGVIKISVNL